QGKGGTGDKAGTGKGGTGGKAGEGKAGAGEEGGTAPKPGDQPAGTAAAAGGDIKAQIEAALKFVAPDSKPADREKAAEEAAKVNELIKGATNAQKALLAKLAEEGGGEYRVPASEWMQRLMTATKDITEEDLQYLMSLDWQPSSLSAEELR